MRGDMEAKSPPKAQRKLLKPQVERRRRERINSCLEQLRVLLSKAMKNEQKLKNPKMEKAEILEYTVEFLQSKMKSAERFHKDLQSMDYQSGFQQCLQATVNFMARHQRLSPSHKDVLFHHSSFTNLCTMASNVDQCSLRRQRLMHPKSPGTSPHNYSPASHDVHSDCHPDQMCRSWRPWL
ncbi:transcription factor HES-7.1-like [Dendropsophus ebraccatus]|uniref:transcription factor HES-7.1-like n=1 Tax=Dendropsophus ebraccatus TaxID=150705 RepID=UPI0038310B1B